MTICSRCCGEDRLRAIDCPADCPYVGAERYQQSRRIHRSQSAGRPLIKLLGGLWDRDDETRAALFIATETYVYGVRSGQVSDEQFTEACADAARRLSPLELPGTPSPLTTWLLVAIDDRAADRKLTVPQDRLIKVLERLGSDLPTRAAAQGMTIWELVEGHCGALDLRIDLGYDLEEFEGHGGSAYAARGEPRWRPDLAAWVVTAMGSGAGAPFRACLVAATEREWRPLAERLTSRECVAVATRVVTGVGKASAAAATAEALAACDVDMVVNFGCAGAYPEAGLAVGDVVLANGDVLADEGVESPDGFLSLEQLGLATYCAGESRYFNEVPTAVPKAQLLDDLRASTEARFHIDVGLCATVSLCAGTDVSAAARARRWSPVAETMEGAAVALAAFRRRLPCLGVRGISNLVGDRDRTAWDIETACDHAADIVSALLERRGLLGSLDVRDAPSNNTASTSESEP